MKSVVFYNILRAEIRPYLPGLVVVLVLMLIGTGLDVLSPWPFKLLIDNVLGNEMIEPSSLFGRFVHMFETRLSLGFFVVFIFFTINISSIIVEYISSFALKHRMNQFEFSVSRRAFANIEHFSMGFYKYREVGDYLYRLEDDVSAVGTFVRDGMFPVITSSVYILLAAVVMMFISVPMTFISLAVVPFLALVIVHFNRKIVRVTNIAERRGSALYSFIEQALTQLKVIQAFSQERRSSERYTHRLDMTLASELRLHRFNLLLTAAAGLMIAACYAIIIIYGIQGVIAGTLTTGLIIVFIFYLDYLTTPLISLMDGISTIKEEGARMGRLGEFFEAKHLVSDTGTVTSLHDTALVFDHVTLVSREQKEILRDVSFRIEAGERVAVVGKSGAGKTTLISLIPRLEEPTSGNILIGGRDVREYTLNVLRSKITIVPQETILFDDTIYNIIAFGEPHCTFEDVQRAARLVGAHTFIERLPQKYDFKVGQHGNLLSGGQRQRLIMARAFVKKGAEIYIFDEPTSALDIKTKEAVLKTLYRVTKGKTTIIVAHRPKTIMGADRTIVLDHGEVVDAGSHHELIRRCKVYQELFHEFSRY